MCFCVKPDLNLDGGHLPLGISLWLETMRIEVTDHPRRHGDGNFSGVILPFGCLIDFYPMAPKVRRDRNGGGFKTPTTPSDTIRTSMKEETTGS